MIIDDPQVDPILHSKCGRRDDDLLQKPVPSLYGEVFDLVVTDLNMPGMAGDELAQELIRIRPDVPIILCSGFSERLVQKRARMVGIRKLIRKPLAMNVLAQSVRDVLDES